MPERTCPCGQAFTPRTGNQRYHDHRCAKRHENAKRRSQPEHAQCKACGQPFTRGRDVRQVYCTDQCKRTHRSADYRQRGITPPSARPDAVQPIRYAHTKAMLIAQPTARDRTLYRLALRADPCAYCGERPCQGIDHIEPTGSTGDRADTANMTGCCKRCNETKRSLPLLSALPWIPLSREYHDMRRALFTARASS